MLISPFSSATACPAFFKSSNIRNSKRLQSLQSYLKDQGIASTLPQHQIDQRERSKIEYRFWKQGIDAVIPGYDEKEMEKRLVDFVRRINFSELTEQERELLFSAPLKRDPVSRMIQEYLEGFMKEWTNFLEEQSQQYMSRLSDIFKMRFGT